MEDLKQTHLNKHVAAIHCSNNIGLLQRKMFNVLLFKAYPKLMEDDFHYISLAELSRMLDYNSKDSAKLKKAFKNLQSTTVEWNIIEDGDESEGEVWCSSTLLASSVIDSKRGFCRYEYSKTLAELLFQPDVYARIDLRIQNKFKSSYGLALYENCVRFRSVKTTGWIAIDKFKKLMGVSEDKYTKFSDFNRRVLIAAIDEINEISDIFVELQTRRVAQQVISLRFSIANKRKTLPLGIINQTEIELQDDISSEIADVLKDKFFASKQEIANLSKQYEVQFLQEKIQVVLESDSYKKGQVRVPLALLKSALKNDYASPKTKIIIPESKKLKKISWDQQEKYNSYIKSCILDRFASLNENEKNRIEQSFVGYLNDKIKQNNLSYKIALDMYQSRGIKGASSEFVEFVILDNESIVDGLNAIEDFVKNNLT